MGGIGVADAARNNAAWCDAVCCAHGAAGEFSDSYWLSRAAVPPFHPNLVTLAPASEPALAAVRELEQTRPAASCAVKDSFAVLALEPLGFRLLFAAEWIARPALSRPSGQRSRAGWLRVETESALSAWEAAWGESRGRSRIFLPALLRRTDFAFLAALDGGGAIAAGVVAHRTGSAVGLSNAFAHGEEAVSLRAAGVEAASDAFPGLPLVGYEAGPALAASRALGFASLGPLRIWAREEGPRPHAASR